MAYDSPKLPPKSGGLNAITVAMSLIAVLLMMQIWFLNATLDSYLFSCFKIAGCCAQLWSRFVMTM
jgi:hypothetical protein